MSKIVSDERSRELRELMVTAKAQGAQHKDFLPFMSSPTQSEFLRGNRSLREDTAAKLEAFLAKRLNGAAPAPATEPEPAIASVELAAEIPDEQPNHNAYVSKADQAALLREVDRLRAGRTEAEIARELGLPAPTLHRARRTRMTRELGERFRAALARAARPGIVSKTSPIPRGSLAHLREQARTAISAEHGGDRPALARKAGITTSTLARFLDGGTALSVEDANALAAVVDTPGTSAPAAGEPETAQDLLDLFARLALRFVLHQATRERKGPGQ